MILNLEFYANQFSATQIFFCLMRLSPTATFHVSCALILIDNILTHLLFRVFTSTHFPQCTPATLFSRMCSYSSTWLHNPILCCLPLIMTLSLVRFSSPVLSTVCALCLLFLVLSCQVLTLRIHPCLFSFKLVRVLCVTCQFPGFCRGVTRCWS